MSARTDTERLDWLNAHGERVEWVDPESGDASACLLAYSLTGDDDRPIHETAGGTLREAIDAAIDEPPCLTVVPRPDDFDATGRHARGAR